MPIQRFVLFQGFHLNANQQSQDAAKVPIKLGHAEVEFKGVEHHPLALQGENKPQEPWLCSADDLSNPLACGGDGIREHFKAFVHDISAQQPEMAYA